MEIFQAISSNSPLTQPYAGVGAFSSGRILLSILQNLVEGSFFCFSVIRLFFGESGSNTIVKANLSVKCII